MPRSFSTVAAGWLSRVFRQAHTVLWIAGGVLCAAGLLSHLSGGLAFTLGPLRVSARDPWRLYMEGALLLAFACMAIAHPRQDATRGARWLGVLVATLFFVTLVMESSPRRVGDGAEYFAMARQFSLARPPGMTASELVETEAWLARMPGVGPVPLARPHLVGADGRQDLDHFWLYPLLAAPWLGAAESAGVHPNHAFTAVNVLLMAGAVAAAARVIPLGPALLVVAGPLVWWLDKAHTEVFTVTLLVAAICWMRSRPLSALAALGTATAQNPALGAPLALAVLYVGWAGAGARPHAWMGALVAFALAGLHPLYYWWHLGITSPLTGTIAPSVPGATAVLTPLLDLDLGLVVHFPALVFALVLCLSPRATPAGIRQRWPEVILATLALLSLLVAFAQTANVNHGGTPGPSRYGLWLVPLAIPLLHAGATRLGRARRTTLTLVSAGSLAWCAYAYHPKLPEALHDTHTAIASWVFERWPGLYSPLPEVFAERTLGYDGSAVLPVATSGCEKVLLAGDGSGVPRWPLPCGPAPVPEECGSTGALCYASAGDEGYRFSRAPAQPTFAYDIDRATSWTADDEARWREWMSNWRTLRGVKPWSEASFVRDASGVARVRAWQNDSELLVWLTPAPDAQPRLLLRPPAPSAMWWLEAGGPPPAPGTPQGTVDGETWVAAPSEGPLLLILRSRGPSR